MKRSFIFLLLPLLAIGACKPKEVSERPVIEYVSEIIQERANPAHQLLGSFKPGDANGNIVVFGPLEEVRPMSASLLRFDRFDNVDARPVRDSLLDFSGEVVTRVIMSDKSPLSAVQTDEGTRNLRELTVKAALASLDTLGHRTRGKVVVLTSSAMAAYGKYDLDSLLRAFHIGNVVFFPLDLMAEKALAKPEARIGIVSSQPAGIYEEYFRHRDEFEGIDVGVYPKEMILDSVSVVDTLSLDMLLLDDYTVPADTLRSRFPGVEVVTPGSVTSEACFKAMRRRNIFTHRVAYPKRETFTASLSEDSEFILTDSDDRELF
ncbi:MAG: hypothetical protein J5748_01445 [Bacteroidales bacterium]|nr:hypothetical protein [Bacteroidales bacterium]